MSQDAAAQTKANDLRAHLGLGDAPIGDLIDVFSSLGVDVIVTGVTQGQHGLTYHDPVTGRVVVAVGIVNNAARHRSNLAHELGHVCFKDFSRDENYTGKGPNETRADSFARHFLFPLGAARRIASLPLDAQARMNQAVEFYGVSPKIASIQLMRASAITNEEANALTSRKKTSSWYAQRYGWTVKLQQDNAAAQVPQAPRSLLHRAVSAYEQGLLPLTELARWHGLSIQDMQQRLDAEGISTQPTPAPDDDLDGEPDELPPLP